MKIEFSAENNPCPLLFLSGKPDEKGLYDLLKQFRVISADCLEFLNTTEHYTIEAIFGDREIPLPQYV